MNGTSTIPMGYLITCMVIMAVMTYLIRMIPMAVFRSKIKSRFIQSFLYYVPYVVLTAMTIPAIFYSTGYGSGQGSLAGAVIGTAAAVLLAIRKKGLLTVAVGASAAVLLTELALGLM